MSEIKSITYRILDAFDAREKTVYLIFFACILLILFGSLANSKFLTVNYILQQLQIASIIGIVAAGAMIVILLGHIDLSIPWTMTWAAMISIMMRASGDPLLGELAVPAGIFIGAFIGLINGLGVAVLRIPSMVWTLAVNSMALGIAILVTGGPALLAADAPPLMITLAIKYTFGIPNAIFVWMAVSIFVVFVLKKTIFGKYLYAIGNTEKVVYLSGVKTSLVVLGAFVLSGALSGLGGLLLCGYANQTYLSMGDPYLLPAIAAVVLGGTSILGGRGAYMGTAGGALFITLLASVLSVMQMPEAGRQLAYGTIIIVMLLLHRLRRSTTTLSVSS
jgi:ribose transport system permease protein